MTEKLMKQNVQDLDSIAAELMDHDVDMLDRFLSPTTPAGKAVRKPDQSEAPRRTVAADSFVDEPVDDLVSCARFFLTAIR
jgi:hypothetical protein